MSQQIPAGSRDYGQPFNWWGYRSTPEQPMSIIQLIEQESIDLELASFLWLAIEQRASVIVAATPHEAGKTTFLTALLDFLPDEVELIYLRGWYERFEFMLEQRDPSHAYMLSNEISSHLPIYMWGRGVRRLFEAAAHGYGLAATVHADGAADVIRLLANYPLEVPLPLLTNIDFVVTLSFRKGQREELRRLMRLEVIEDRGSEPVPRTLARREVISTELELSPGMLINTLVRHFGLDRDLVTSEYARRVSFLDRLVRQQVFAPRDVRQALRRHRSLVPELRSQSPRG